MARLTQKQARLVRDVALKVKAQAAIAFENARRRVGPPRAGHCGLRAHVDHTSITPERATHPASEHVRRGHGHQNGNAKARSHL
jgi:hypothetical protein